MNSNDSLPSQPERRSFLKEVAAIVIGAVTTLVPLASGLLVFFDPLRKKPRFRAIERALKFPK